MRNLTVRGNSGVFKEIGIGLSAAISLIGFFLLCFPKIVTGDFANVTITSIKIDSHGRVNFEVSAETTVDTIFEYVNYDGSSDVFAGGNQGGGFLDIPELGWPVSSGSGGALNLNTENLPPFVDVKSASWFNRLLVHAGGTRRIHLGERYYMTNFRDSQGHLHAFFMQIARDKIGKDLETLAKKNLSISP